MDQVLKIPVSAVRFREEPPRFLNNKQALTKSKVGACFQFYLVFMTIS